MDFASFLKRSGEVNEWRYCSVGVGPLSVISGLAWCNCEVENHWG